MKKSDLFFNVLRLPVDLMMLFVAGLVTYFFRTEILSAFRPVLFDFNLPFLKYLYLVFSVSLLFVGAYAFSGLYSMKSRVSVIEEFFRILIASSAGIMAVIIYIFLRQELFDSRFLIMGGLFFAIIFVALGRLIVRYLQKFFVAKYNFGIHNVIIVGSDEGASTLVQSISDDRSLGYRIANQLPDVDITRIKSILDQGGIDEVFLSHLQYSPEKIMEFLDLCQERHIAFKFIPHIAQLLTSNFDMSVFKGLPMIEVKRTSLDGWGRVIKRTIDIIGALVGLIIFSPVLGIIALAVKLETEGPVFVRLKRISKNNEFNLYKFRSMVNNAESLKPYLVSLNERKDGPLFKMKNDPRVTKVGRFIRRFRLDELPQFINVLVGEMSLVGPRPHQPNEVALYEKHHKKVLAIKAGATGMAQVSGSSDLNFEREVALDSYYVDSWSLWLDIKIILKTAIKIFFDRSAV